MMTQRGADVVGIDARAAVRPELGGVERWARELAARLPALRPGGYAVLRPPPALAHRAGHAWEQVALPVRAARMRALLCPANLAPLAHPRVTVVIHDAAVLRHPGWYSGAYAAWQRLLLPAIARRAQRVVTVSEFSRHELAELLGVDADVVAGGVDERFSPAADPAPARRALGLARPYVLTVASHTARKNLAALVPAARALARDVDVVVAGGHRPQFAREGGLEGLRLLGPVDDAHLPGLYAGAEAFALPSLYEGFGLPCIEAMASGTPVVASHAGALPETCGDAALLVDPASPGEVAEAVLSVLRSPEVAERLRGAGLARARGFTWARTAARIDDMLAAEARTL
jgi:glycosyltransferase involved in cell wall biosynthesis